MLSELAAWHLGTVSSHLVNVSHVYIVRFCELVVRRQVQWKEVNSDPDVGGFSEAQLCWLHVYFHSEPLINWILPIWSSKTFPSFILFILIYRAINQKPSRYSCIQFLAHCYCTLAQCSKSRDIKVSKTEPPPPSLPRSTLHYIPATPPTLICITTSVQCLRAVVATLPDCDSDGQGSDPLQACSTSFLFPPHLMCHEQSECLQLWLLKQRCCIQCGRCSSHCHIWFPRHIWSVTHF